MAEGGGTVSTDREQSVANPVLRMSGADLSRMVDAIAVNKTNPSAYNLNTTERYYLMRMVIDWAKANGGKE